MVRALQVKGCKEKINFKNLLTFYRIFSYNMIVEKASLVDINKLFNI